MKEIVTHNAFTRDDKIVYQLRYKNDVLFEFETENCCLDTKNLKGFMYKTDKDDYVVIFSDSKGRQQKHYVDPKFFF